jgi:Transposase domain (DUF772)
VSHTVYQNMLTTKLKNWQRRKDQALRKEWLDAALLLFRVDLDSMEAELKKLYASQPRGRPPIEAVSMLRALLLMMILKYKSITKFAAELRRQPRLAQIAGFKPFVTPGVGTFYLFIDRLEDGPYEPACPHRIKPSKLRKGRHRRNLKQEREAKELQRKKILTECDSITQNLKQQLLASAAQPRPRDYQQRMEDMLFQTAVNPSIKRGLLGDLQKLVVCGDGSALPTGASYQGRAICSCRQEGIYSCDHDRLYTDGSATWGYDSYRECFYWGYCFYQHCVFGGGHDLPIHISIAPAHESDFTHSMKSLDRLIKTFSEHNLTANIYAGAYDSGHDGIGNYEFLMAKGINPVISLNPRRGQHVKPTGSAQQVDENGVPVCIAGLTMRRHGKAKQDNISYTCPVKRPSHENGKHIWRSYPQECPLKVLCQPDTKCGPVVSVNSKDDPRHYPAIERGSERFRKVMDQRTTCERSNSIKKVTHQLEQRPCRSATHYLMRLYLISIVEHAKAWLADDKKQLGDDWQSLTDLTKLAALHKAA